MGIWKPSKKVIAELVERGVRTRATVVRIAWGGSTSGHSDSEGRIDDPEGTSRIKTTVRITTPDGETFETRTRLMFLIGGLPKAGDTVPVIYDPDDHDIVEVDEMAHRMEVLGESSASPVLPNEITDISLSELGDIASGRSVPGFDPAALSAAADDAQKVMADHLEQMRLLHQQGALTDEQFESIRRQMPGQA